MKRFFTPIVLVLLTISPAFAADWSKYKTFANTKCESPKVIADMVETAKTFRGFKFVSQLTVMSSKTVEARPNFLECRVHLSILYRGQPQTLGGVFTVHLASGSLWNATFNQQTGPTLQ